MEIIERLGIETFDVPSVSKQEIESLENSLGIHLPELYKELLLKYNGGAPNLNTYLLKDNEWIISHFFFLESNKQNVAKEYMSSEGILSQYRSLQTELPKNFFPFAAEPTGDIFIFDTKFGKESPVFMWLHDDPEIEIIKLADDFEEFVNALQENPEEIGLDT